MKREWCLLVFVLVLFFTTGLTSAFSGGDGSFLNPYNITNCTELNETRNDLTANYSLGNNINMSAAGCEAFQTGAGFVPIADYSGNGFEGTFQGNNKTISNLYINNDSADYVGLFGFAVGNISDLGLLNINITGGSYVGGLVGEFDLETISNCFSTGSVTGNYDVGGLVGDLYGSVFNSYSTTTINANGDSPSALGGLVGALEPLTVWGLGTISNSYATGDVSGIGAVNIGGLVGFADENSSISNSYATGDISSVGQDYVGGLTGSAYGNISYSYSTGNVSGRDLVGGFTGYTHDSGIIYNSYSTGNVSGDDYIGGFIGEIFGNISNSYSTGNVNGTNYIGGFIGGVFGLVSDSYATGNVSGVNFTGGFVGFANGDISNSYSTGTASGTDYIGGFIGWSNRTVSGSYWDINTSIELVMCGFVGSASSGCNDANGKNTTEMQTQSTFTGWDFTDIWVMGTGSYEYPILQWQPTSEEDTTYPQFSSYNDTSASLSNSGTGLFNVTVLNTNGTVLLEINGANITATNLSANVYNASYNFTTNGTYSYKWHSWGNGSTHNHNVSSIRNYTVNYSDIYYPQFSNPQDNNATLSGSGTAWFNITLANTNGTVLLSINNNNYTATNLSANVYNVSVTLTTGTYNYTWISWGNGSTHNYNTSNTRAYVVNATPETVEETDTSSTYYPKTYYSNEYLPTTGNNFNLRYTDKIRFVVRSVNHTLTMQRFNSTTARVLIQSNPITAYLLKGTLYEFDLNNDSVNDVKARYDGMNGTKAMVFIQEIVPKVAEVPVTNKTEVSNEVKTEEKIEDISYSYWKEILSVIIVLLISFAIWRFFGKRIEEYFWIKGIERSRKKNKSHQYYP
jgi:hypothetical protein